MSRPAPVVWVEIVALDAGGADQTYYWSTADTWGTPDGSTVTFIDGRIKQPPTIARHMFGEGRTYGRSALGGGALVLENTDGALDGIIANNFDKAEVYVRLRVNAQADVADPLLWSGYCGQPSFTLTDVTLPLRDKAYALDVPLQPTKYGGTNALPAGMDGTANDIKGRPIPILYGVVRNATPVCVNTSRLVYQVHDKAFQNASVGTVWSFTPYDKRSALTAGVSRSLAYFQAGQTVYTVSSIDTATDQITLSTAFAESTGEPVQITTDTTLPGGLPAGASSQYYFARKVSASVISLHPTAGDAGANTNKVDLTSSGSGTHSIRVNATPYGCYDWCNDATGFFFRLGSQPVGQLTFDARNNSANASATTGVELVWLMHELLDRAGAYINSTNLSGSQDAGVYLTEEVTVREQILRMAEGVGAGVITVQDATPGDITVDILTPDYSSSTVRLTVVEHDLKGGIERLTPMDEWEGGVVWRVNFHYRRNHTRQSPTDIPGATAADQAFAQEEWRVLQVSDATVLTQYPGASELNVYSHLDDATAAATQAADILARYKVRRSLYVAPIDINQLLDGHAWPVSAAQLELNDVVNLSYPRFGLDAGVDLTVLGVKPNYSGAPTTTLYLWR